MKTSREIEPVDRRNIDVNPSLDPVSRCIERVETVIREEMQTLRNGGKIDFEALNQRKSHVLLEVLRLSKSITSHSANQSGHQLRSLQKLLLENSDLLARRLRATEEITGIIVRNIRDSESDGTYSIRSSEPRRK